MTDLPRGSYGMGRALRGVSDVMDSWGLEQLRKAHEEEAERRRLALRRRRRRTLLVTALVLLAVIGMSQVWFFSLRSHDLAIVMSFVTGCLAGWPLGSYFVDSWYEWSMTGLPGLGYVRLMDGLRFDIERPDDDDAYLSFEPAPDGQGIIVGFLNDHDEAEVFELPRGAARELRAWLTRYLAVERE